MSLKVPTKLLLIQLTSVIFFQNFVFTGQAKAVHSDTHSIQRINNSLEQLELNMRYQNKKQICLNAQKSADLIANNKNTLKDIEPNYNWKEIRKVLILVQREHCDPKASYSGQRVKLS